jgi:hypothetical protein
MHRPSKSSIIYFFNYLFVAFFTATFSASSARLSRHPSQRLEAKFRQYFSNLKSNEDRRRAWSFGINKCNWGGGTKNSGWKRNSRGSSTLFNFNALSQQNLWLFTMIQTRFDGNQDGGKRSRATAGGGESLGKKLANIFLVSY